MNKRLFLFLFYLCISVYGFSADRVEGIRGGGCLHLGLRPFFIATKM